MKKIYLLLLALTSQTAVAGDGGGAVGATEITQIRNNVELAAQYAQQIQQYSTQLKQYQTELQNLQLNPASLMGTDASRLINGIGGVMQAGESIGGSMAQIDRNFSTKFKSPLAGTFSEKFKTWTNTSQDTLGGAMRAAGMHRDAYESDTAALNALFNKSQQSQGNLAALQTLSEITVAQVQQTQKLNDLIASQNMASSAYMAGQNAKEQQVFDMNSQLTIPDRPLPVMSGKHKY